MTLLVAVALLQQPVSMAEDPRLNVVPEIRAEARSVADVLKQFQAATGVAIEATVVLRDELVTLYTANRSAAESLTTLADHFGWSWQTSNGGYFLIQSQESKRAEDLRRRELMIADFVAVRAGYRKALDKLKTTDFDQYERHLLELEDLLQKNPRDEELRKRLYSEYATAQLAHDPYNRFVAEVIVSLSDAKLDELVRRTRVVLNYYPTSAQAPLGRGKKAAEALVDELTKPVPPPDPKEEEDEDYMPPQKPLDASKIASVRLALSVNRGGMWSTSYATVSILGKDGTVLRSSPISLRNDEFEEEAAKRQLDDPKLTQSITPSADLKAKLDWQPKDEGAYILRMLGGFFDKDNAEPLAQDAWYLTETCKSIGMPIIADAYDTHTNFMMRPQMPKGKTGSEIIQSVINQRQTAAVISGWIRIRDADWQLARATTVPRRILFPLRETYIKQGGMSLDQLADMATRLTDLQATSPTLQIATGVGMSGVPFDDPAAIYMLRFWAGLTPFQKRALQSGSQVDVASLLPPARSSLFEYVYRTGDDDGSGRMGMFGMEDEEQPAEVAVPMPPEAAPGMYEEKPEPDTEITQILPNGPLPGAAIALAAKNRSGIGVALGNESTQIPFAVPISAMADFFDVQKEMPGFKVMGVRPALIETYTFTIFCSSDVNRTFSLGTGWCDPVLRYGQIDTLPTDILAKLREYQKKREDARRRQEEPPPPSR